jgi:hypothetical protein
MRRNHITVQAKNGIMGKDAKNGQIKFYAPERPFMHLTG